jgi:hypothetical protein
MNRFKDYSRVLLNASIINSSTINLVLCGGNAIDDNRYQTRVDLIDHNNGYDLTRGLQ